MHLWGLKTIKGASNLFNLITKLIRKTTISTLEENLNNLRTQLSETDSGLWAELAPMESRAVAKVGT